MSALVVDGGHVFSGNKEGAVHAFSLKAVVAKFSEKSEDAEVGFE